jgi:imidazole glycerol-phosphate synthase subunit HisH
VITIIDYGAGNLKSVVNAITKLGFQPKVTSSVSDVLNAKLVILPGVGAAGDTMENLRKLDLIGPIRQYIAGGRPFLGICIGLQVLFTRTEEGGGHDCLNIIPGQVRRLPEGQKVPQIGWNQVTYRTANPIFTGIPDGTNFYFVHSYYADPEDKSLIIGETEYGIPFCSAVARGNLVAIQFHPEKSGDNGLRVYENFIKRALDKVV